MRKAFLAAALAAFAAHGATVKIATRDWVRSYVANVVNAEAQTRTNVVTVGGHAVTNFTFSSPFYSEDATNVVSIALTVSYALVPTNTMLASMPPSPPTPRSFSLLELLVPTANAELVPWDDDGYQLQLYLHNVEIGTGDAAFPFHFEPPKTFAWKHKLPLVPPDEPHRCLILDGGDCVCEDARALLQNGYKMQYPDNYYAPENVDDTGGEQGDIMNWLDYYDNGLTTEKVLGETKYFYLIGPLPDGGNVSVNVKDIGKTAAWREALKGAFAEWKAHILNCMDAYDKTHYCSNFQPQHDWGTVGTTGNYRYGEEETIQYCRRNSDHSKTGWRAHNHDGHWGAWLYREVNGASVKIRYCQRCGKEDGPYAVDAGTLTCSGNSHIPLSMVATNGANRCGCVCGEVDPENFKEEQYHLFVAGSQTPCLCQCGHYHRGVAPSAYDVNREVACQNICTHCNRRHNSNGIDVPDAGAEDHQPRTSGHCGCRCGKYTHNDHDPECAKFHIRKSGDCCCLGADGSGGDWHFPCAKSGCTKICEYDYNGFGPHLAVTRKVNTEERPLVTAEPKDHTRNDASCGCKCGEMDSSNRDEWNGVEDLHKWQSGHCICVCGMSPEHHGISRQPCDDICRGHEATHQRQNGQKRCPLTVSGVRIGSNIKYSHTPRADGCGCACGDFGAGDYSGNSLEDSLFHNGTGSPACWCSCGKNGQNAWHTFVTNNPCVNICNLCKETTSRGKTFRTKVVAVNPAKDHTAVTNRCGCECRADTSKNYKKYHPILDGHCGCVECNRNNYREHWYIDHVTEDNETGNGPSYTCGSCGNTIGRIRHTVTCKTNPQPGGCWLCPYNYYVESGHADGCGALPRDPSEDDEEDDTPIFGPPDDKPPATCTAVTFDGNVCGHKLNEDGSCPNEVNHNSSGSIDETGTSDTGEPGGNSGNNGGGTIDPLNF